MWVWISAGGGVCVCVCDLAAFSEDQYLTSVQKVRDEEKKLKNVIELHRSENYKVSFAKLLYFLADLNFPRVNSSAL